MRRGRPTVWKLVGVPQAINAGDLMYSIAVENALKAGSDVARFIVQSTRLMIEGQGLDIGFEQRWVDVGSYLEMIDKKTGSLLRCSFVVGGMIAGANSAELEMLDLIGSQLGRAFQIKDDLLGVWGDGDVTGKPHGSDIRRKKKSFPVVLAMQRADDRGKSLLEELYSKESISNDDVSNLILLFTNLEIKQKAEEEVEMHLGKASDALDLLSLSEQGRKTMDELIGYLARREK